ncbi:class IV adenylate cyclase [Halocatena pleomorpha]|uniref:Class IV adenylate cyclase n=1 Tax=Halocatena pleomorpha TaxID=1785090 RepID=A0A3P3RJ98_9EURY|nr:class IV adenylate cyclase [Halocatena pleomorpha]RRJ33465.1 class IV adenylate cyclase [Halocatena pleomorpha]
MYEVEVKVKASHDRAQSRLANSDATHTGTVKQTDTYYDAPHREFAATDEALRIRTERTLDRETGTTTRLTYKGPRIDDESKTRAEIETGVASHEQLADILENLGFAPVATVEKTRDRYAIDAYTVTLDVVTDLGTFVEVETELEPDATTEAIEAARDRAFSLLREFGFDPEKGIRTSYLGLLLNNQ